MTAPILRGLSNVLLVLAVLLGGLGFWLSRPSPPRLPRMESHEATFGRLPVGQTATVAFRLVNDSPKSLSVFGGIGKVCQISACFTPENLPLEVPAGESREVRFVVEARRAGELEMPWRLYTTADGAGAIDVTIRGEIIETSTGS